MDIIILNQIHIASKSQGQAATAAAAWLLKASGQEKPLMDAAPVTIIDDISEDD